ncbi:MAG TPA: Ig-like domain-containing protein [Solirubrobacterales bacterium]
MFRCIATALCMGALVFAAGASAAPLSTVTSMDCSESDAGAGEELIAICSLRVKSDSGGTITGFAPITSDSSVRIRPATNAGFQLSRVDDGESSFVFAYETSVPGPHTLTANYLGDANHAPSQGTLAVVVKPSRNPVQMTLNCGATPKVGQRSSCSVVARDVGATRTSPTGFVEFNAFGPNRSGFNPSRCKLAPLGAGLSFCSVGFTPVAAGAEEVFLGYEGDKTHRTAILDTMLKINP